MIGIEEVQIERRRERAREEIARVVNRGGHTVFSSFDVTSIPDAPTGSRFVP